MRARRAAAIVAAAVACVLDARGARAASGDGAYGRLDGDASLVVNAGGALLRGHPGGGAEARLRYLDAAGVGVSFVHAGADARSLSIPFELRPLFPIRFLKAQQTGLGLLDLTLDSLALELGPSWELGRARPGLMVGGALELPLFGQARGLFLRVSGAARWSSVALEGGDEGVHGLFTLSLGWHEPLRLGLVDAGDGRLK